MAVSFIMWYSWMSVYVAAYAKMIEILWQKEFLHFLLTGNPLQQDICHIPCTSLMILSMY